MKIRDFKLKGAKDFFIEFYSENLILLSRRNQLFSCDMDFNKIKKIGEVKINIFDKILSTISITRRLRRLFFYNVVPISNDKFFVSFNKKIGILSKTKYEEIKGMKKPTRILRNACAIDEDGGIFFGEYIPNTNRNEVKIYYLPKNSVNLEVRFVFKKNNIRHVHGIYLDPFTNHLWVVTGDNKNECKIFFTKDKFKNIEIVGQGDESWRAISIIFERDFVYYGTDAEFSQNYIYKINKTTYKREIMHMVDGPIYYSKKIGKNKVFIVTAEGCPSQKINKLDIFYFDKNNRFTRIKSYLKDFLPIQFMPGTIQLSNGNHPTQCFGYGIGLKDLNLKTIEIFENKNLN